MSNQHIFGQAFQQQQQQPMGCSPHFHEVMEFMRERQARAQEQSHPHGPFGYPGVNTPPFSPNTQPWNGYPQSPPPKPRSLADAMNDLFNTGVKHSDDNSRNTPMKPIKPINEDLVYISNLFTKLCAECDDAEVTKWFWVDSDYFIDLFQSGEFDNGVWHEAGAHAYRTITRDVVVTTPTFKFVYRPSGVEMTAKDNRRDITPEIITSGLIPALKLIAYLCMRNEDATVHPEPQDEPTPPTEVPPKRRRKTSKVKQMAFRAEVDTLVSDDDAMGILDIPAKSLYDVVFESDYKSLTLVAPAGQYVKVFVDLHTLDMVITCGTQTIHIPRCDHTRPISDYIEIDVNPTTQTEDVAAILSAIYVWSQANDIHL